MAITTMDGLVAALGTAQTQQFYFPTATGFNGGWLNLNQAVTSSFGIMAVPAAASAGGTTYNRTAISTGFPRFSNPGGSNNQYLARLSGAAVTPCTLHIYDLLWACSGLSGALNTAQAVTGFSGLPSRGGTGNGAEIWIGCSGAIGATAHNVTVQYTNSAGTSGRNTVSTAGITSMPANRMYQVPLQSGDNGVQSVQSLTLSASSGTAGNLWVLLMDRVASIPLVSANIGAVQDFADLGMPELLPDAAPLFVHQGTTSSSGIIMGQLSIIEG